MMNLCDTMFSHITLLTRAHKSPGRNHVGSKRFQHRLHVRHQQRRRHSFACHVGNAKRRVAIAKLQHVEIVAADGARRLPGDRDVKPFDLAAALSASAPLEFPATLPTPAAVCRLRCGFPRR